MRPIHFVAAAAPIPAFVLAFALAFALPATADTGQDTPTLTASGEGTAHVTPDIAVVTLGVSSRGDTAAKALADNSTSLTAAIGAIEAAGVTEKDVGTSGLNIYPVYAQNSDGSQVQPPKVVGYEVSNQVTVTIRDISKAGDLLDKVVAAGANQVNGISFDVSDSKGPGDAALKDAIADARRKGEIMAEAAGVKLGRILSVTSGEEGAPPRPVFAAMALKAAPSTPVMPGEQALTVNATVVWEIAPQ
jgi:uncharacterized protein YggE